ncbi:MAG: SCO family protein [Cyanobacteria bacterium J06588_4]
MRLQDQSGAKFLLSDFFVGQPTVVVFFFTRCGNPSKCPLTITKLSRLQERLREMKSSIRTVAITYDPDYDDPRRLKQYARSWGVSIDENHRLVRALDNQASLRDFFKLGVSYGKSTVNQHQLETYLLDQQGTLIGALRRKRLDASKIIAEMTELMT